jgi:hypothetical protein
MRSIYEDPVVRRTHGDNCDDFIYWALNSNSKDDHNLFRRGSFVHPRFESEVEDRTLEGEI